MATEELLDRSNPISAAEFLSIIANKDNKITFGLLDVATLDDYAVDNTEIDLEMDDPSQKIEKKSEKKTIEVELCIICKCEYSNCIIQKCGHLCACLNCWDMYVRNFTEDLRQYESGLEARNLPILRCPSCNTPCEFNALRMHFA